MRLLRPWGPLLVLSVVSLFLAGCAGASTSLSESTSSPAVGSTTTSSVGSTSTSLPVSSSSTGGPSGGSLQGSSFSDDLAGDASLTADFQVSTIEGSAVGDLTRVDLSMEGEALVVNFTHVEDLPSGPLAAMGRAPSVGDPVHMNWSVQIEQAVSQTVTISVTLTDSYVAEVGVNPLEMQRVDAECESSGKTLLVRVPLGSLPQLDPSFRWYAMSQWTAYGGDAATLSSFIDVVPGEGITWTEEVDKYVNFPGP